MKRCSPHPRATSSDKFLASLRWCSETLGNGKSNMTGGLLRRQFSIRDQTATCR